MNHKRLTRSNDKILLGVCSGIADFVGWPKTTVRMLWVVFTFMGFGFFAYPILAFFMPADSDSSDDFNNYRVE